jgi:hypothetical protein
MMTGRYCIKNCTGKHYYLSCDNSTTQTLKHLLLQLHRCYQFDDECVDRRRRRLPMNYYLLLLIGSCAILCVCVDADENITTTHHLKCQLTSANTSCRWIFDFPQIQLLTYQRINVIIIEANHLRSQLDHASYNIELILESGVSIINRLAQGMFNLIVADCVSINFIHYAVDSNVCGNRSRCIVSYVTPRALCI